MFVTSVYFDLEKDIVLCLNKLDFSLFKAAWWIWPYSSLASSAENVNSFQTERSTKDSISSSEIGHF